MSYFINKLHTGAAEILYVGQPSLSKSLRDLETYPCIRYEQPGDSFLFSEESVCSRETNKSIYVTDRSTLLSIIRNTDAYNIGSGCIIERVINKYIRQMEDSMEKIPRGSREDL